jgi:hypothetical protein
MDVLTIKLMFRNETSIILMFIENPRDILPQGSLKSEMNLFRFNFF